MEKICLPFDSLRLAGGGRRKSLTGRGMMAEGRGWQKAEDGRGLAGAGRESQVQFNEIGEPQYLICRIDIEEQMLEVPFLDIQIGRFQLRMQGGFECLGC